MSTPLPFWAALRLAAFARNQANWRRTQARRFPNDRNNAPAARTLEELAHYVERLPDTDRHLIQLIELDCFADDQTFHAGPATRRLFMRYGYGSAPEDGREFLRDLVVAAAEDRRREGGGWSVGVGSWRFDYPPGYVAVDQGELVEVASVVAAPLGPPTFTTTSDGQYDIAIPSNFEQRTVRFRVRTRDARHDERWVALSDLDEPPRPSHEPAPAIDERWPTTARDGTDTYRRSRGPLEAGVVEKFELPARDIIRGGRIVGDYFEIDGHPLRDIVVAVEDHPVQSLRYVRVVRCPVSSEPLAAMDARGQAVRAYRARCDRLGTTPGAWVNEIAPRYWGGATLEQLMAEIEGGPDAAGAREELLQRRTHAARHRSETDMARELKGILESVREDMRGFWRSQSDAAPLARASSGLERARGLLTGGAFADMLDDASRCLEALREGTSEALGTYGRAMSAVVEILHVLRNDPLRWYQARPGDTFHATRWPAAPSDRVRALCGQVLELGGATVERISPALTADSCAECLRRAAPPARDEDPVWWSRVPETELVDLALDRETKVGGDAADELLGRDKFPAGNGQWVEDRPDTSPPGRSPGRIPSVRVPRPKAQG